ncbi:Hypothetical protein CINCED_3A011626, partial [Cinara cedri]
IGLMRNGVLVEEGSPQFILAKYNTDTLESAFLKLCCNQNENHIVHNGTVRVNNDNTIPQPKNITKLKNKFKFIRVKALMKKYLHSFSRDYVLMFTMFILPILQALIICNCVGTGISDLKVAIKNDEIDFWGSRRSNIDGCILNEKNDQKISGVIMNRLQSLGYTLNEVADRKTGEMIMSNSSKYIAFIHFPENYTRSFTKFINDRDNYDYQSQAYVNFAMYSAVWPVESQTPLLRMVTELLPMRLAGNVMTNIALKGWTLEHPSVIKNIVVMFSYSVILVLVIIGLGKFKKNMWIMQK